MRPGSLPFGLPTLPAVIAFLRNQAQQQLAPCTHATQRLLLTISPRVHDALAAERRPVVALLRSEIKQQPAAVADPGGRDAVL